MLERNNNLSPDFLKGLGVGVLLVLALGFVMQNVAGMSFGARDAKILKPTTPTQVNNDPSAPAPTTASVPDVTSDDYIYGDVNAPITIVEYSDLQCPFCVRFHPTVKEVVDGSNGNVNWVYRHFPLTSIHPNAQKYAEATLCLADLGGSDAYWKGIDEIFATQPDITDLSGIAKAAGVDASKLQKCTDSGEKASDVQQSSNDAIAAGGQGTPFSVVVGPDGTSIPLSGAVPKEQLQQVIDSLK